MGRGNGTGEEGAENAGVENVAPDDRGGIDGASFTFISS